MNNNSINKQVTSKKKKIPSWGIGIVTLLSSMISMHVGFVIAAIVPVYGVLFWFPIIVIVMSIWGLVRAKEELQQSRKRAAIIGIMLCSTSLIFVLIVLFFLWFITVV